MEENNKNETRSYTKAENLVYKNARDLFELTNKLIGKTSDAFLDVWNIDIEIDKNNMCRNPMEELISMFEWYIDNWKKNHASYLLKNNLKLSKEDKNHLEEIKKNSPAEVTICKQIKQIKLG